MQLIFPQRFQIIVKDFQYFSLFSIDFQCVSMIPNASQLKCFLDFPGWDKRLDQEAISLYFKYGYVPSPKSIFNNIFIHFKVT